MKLTISVPEEKAAFMLELLGSFSYVKMEQASNKKVEKARILQDLKEAVMEVNRAKRGEIELKSAQEMLDEL